MAIPKFLEDIAFVSKLGDNPGTDNGLTTDGFKSVFDKAALKIQEYINDVIVPAIGVQNNPEDGLRMKGNIEMDGNRIVGLSIPVVEDQATPKSYVDNAVSNAESLAKEYTDNKVLGKITSNVVVLKHDAWENNMQTVSVAKVTADPLLTNIIVSADPVDENDVAYNENGVKPYAQMDNAIQFKCSDVPAIDLTVNVMVIV